MPVNVTCACGAEYNLKDEYAGAQLACPKCGAVVNVPGLPPPPPVHTQPGDPAFARDLFLLNERHLGISEKYSVTDKDGAPLMFVERPNYIFLNVLAIFAGLAVWWAVLIAVNIFYRVSADAPVRMAGPQLLWAYGLSTLAAVTAAQGLARKRHITVYRDDSRREVLLKVLQDDRIQLFTASYTVAGPDGVKLARLYKNRLRNLLRKRWYCLAPGGERLFVAREDSMILSILRRFLLGFFGLLRTDFIFLGKDETVLGEFDRRFTILDRYVLDLTADPLRSVDRRVALAMGVLLDTGEKR